jgi:hypothetical protein
MRACFMLARVCRGAQKLWVCTPVRKRDKERERERERERETKIERGIEREKERKRKMMVALKGMTGALAPFSYLVLYNEALYPSK